MKQQYKLFVNFWSLCENDSKTNRIIIYDKKGKLN